MGERAPRASWQVATWGKEVLGGDDLRRIPEIVCDQEGGQGEWGF